MEFETLIQSRRSVRGTGFCLKPRTVIEAIIESAKRAPSSMNTQPWHVHVLTGARHRLILKTAHAAARLDQRFEFHLVDLPAVHPAALQL